MPLSLSENSTMPFGVNVEGSDFTLARPIPGPTYPLSPSSLPKSSRKLIIAEVARLRPSESKLSPGPPPEITGASRILLMFSFFVPDLGLEANHAKVITGDRVDIEAGFVRQNDATGEIVAVAVRIVEIHVLKEHGAAFEAGIKCMIPSDSRGRHGRRCERHRNGQL